MVYYEIFVQNKNDIIISIIIIFVIMEYMNVGDVIIDLDFKIFGR